MRIHPHKKWANEFAPTRAEWVELCIANRPGRQTALHSHSAKSPKYGDVSRWLTSAKSLVSVADTHRQRPKSSRCNDRGDFGLPCFLFAGHKICYTARTKLRFNREVRKSIADELKKISMFGGIGLGVLGYSINAPLVLLGAFLWWIACQIIATLLLAMED